MLYPAELREQELAEREGFEPSMSWPILLSRGAPSRRPSPDQSGRFNPVGDSMSLRI